MSCWALCVIMSFTSDIFRSSGCRKSRKREAEGKHRRWSQLARAIKHRGTRLAPLLPLFRASRSVTI